MVTVHCGGCGGRLGQVGPSVRSGNPKPVWSIEPGWGWSDTHLGRGMLERSDELLRMERRLSHEVTGNPRPAEGGQLRRECDLPVVVRCPRCRKIRWVGPDVAVSAARLAR